jgi:hypothetical protein
MITDVPNRIEMTSRTGGQTPSLSVAVPSRNDNPFATCWTRPGAIAYQFGDGQTAEQLVTKLASQGWWGSINGPHGSGKSTLLETLKPAIEAYGMNVRAISLRNRQRTLPASFLATICERNTVVIIDGYEQLSWFARWQMKRGCRRAGSGLVVTTHTPTRIPTLIRLSPDERLVQRLVAELSARVSTQITAADVAASHACHGSNVREIFFDLYDVHEQRRGIRSHLQPQTLPGV